MKLLLCIALLVALCGASHPDLPLAKDLGAELTDDEVKEVQPMVNDEEENEKPHWVDGVGWSAYHAAMSGRDFFTINSPDAIETRSNDPQAKPYVQGKIQTYYSIDPSEAMKKLAEVGSLLRLAYSGSKGHASSSPILKVLSNYQELVKDSLVVSQTFVQIVLRALKYHKYAAYFVEKDLIEKSLKYLGKCSLMAERMATETEILIGKADDLKDLAVDALVQANNDYVGSRKEKMEIQKTINDLKKEQAERESMKTDLEAMIAEQKEEEKRAAAVAAEKEMLGMIIDVFVPLATTAMTVALPLMLGDEPIKKTSSDEPVLIPAVIKDKLPNVVLEKRDEYFTVEKRAFGGIGGITNLIGGLLGQNAQQSPEGGEPGCGGGSGVSAQASRARCREAAARASRINFQRQQLKNNAALAKAVSKLTDAKNAKDKLTKAIYGLDISIKTMGKVKTIFLNAKTFWVGMQKHLKSISASKEELEDYAEDELLREEYNEALMHSGYSWLTVGKICRKSWLTIRSVDEGVDEIVSNLPTSAEADELVAELGAKIMGDIKDDTKDIEAELKSKHNKLPLPSPLRLPVHDVTLE